MRGRDQLRSRNINAPDASGVRPEPDVGTVTQIESTGRGSDRLNLNANYRVPAKRIFMNANYTLGQREELARQRHCRCRPTASIPDAEWGPSSQDIRHRFNAMVNVPLWLGLRAQHQHERAVGGALHDHHRARRQRRRREQRSAGRRRPQQRARRLAVRTEHAADARLRLRRRAATAAGARRPADRRGGGPGGGGGRRHRRPWRRRWIGGDGAQPALQRGALRAGVQPPEPHELRELQRQPAVAVLRPARRRRRRRGGSKSGCSFASEAAGSSSGDTRTTEAQRRRAASQPAVSERLCLSGRSA